jgi:type I restriction enzyme S subunit
MEEKLPELPKGWVWVKLGEIIEPSTKQVNPLTTEEMKYIGLEHIEKDKGTITGYGSSKEVKSTKSYFNKGDLLYGKLRPYLNKAYLAEFEGVCSSDILVFPIRKHLSNKYLLYIFLNKEFSRYANLHVSGVQHPRTSFNSISKYVFPLPPLPEQYRIVDKIEELFTRLDAGIESLKKVQAQIKRYRQAVLKHAFEGKLTAAWREANKHRLEPASVLLESLKEERKKSTTRKQKDLSPDTSGLPELPEYWEWSSIGAVAEIIMGQSPPGNSYNKDGKGIPLINGPVEFGPTPFSKTRKIKYTTEPKRKCKENDLLICVRGSTTGRINIAGFDACIGRGVASIRPFIFNYYLYYYIHYQQHNIFKLGIGSTFPNVTINMLHNIFIPVAPALEQQKIVEEIERRFSIADRVENIVEQNLKKAERLRQSILKKAFEGKLVPQDPTDEPASVLLERIKAEKEKKRK